MEQWAHKYQLVDAQGRELTPEEAEAVRKQIGFHIVYDEVNNYTDAEWRAIAKRLKRRPRQGVWIAGSGK